MNGMLQTWAELRQFVHHTLCGKENLLVDQFELEVDPLHRQDQFCGVNFTLFGPRQIRLGAIWTVERNSLFFFDAKGCRFQTTQLQQPIHDVPSGLISSQ
ncbi:MAG: hypothetical protein KDA78_02255 [Planctomycetaceae bacterium]|nr:hypothetical protein [Planctomycetaceae bacterium]